MCNIRVAVVAIFLTLLFFVPDASAANGEVLSHQKISDSGSAYLFDTNCLQPPTIGAEYTLVGRSLKTTNILESVNAQAEERCGRVDHWKNSNQKHRWLAATLLDVEPRLRRLSGYRHLPALSEMIRNDLKIKTVEEGGELAA